MKVTIKDIARMAGTSPATVSRVVNRSESGVGDEMREKIMQIIKETGYKPNLIAKSMITNRTHTVAFLSPEIVNPFYHDIIRGVNDYAMQHQYNVLLYNTNKDIEKQTSNVDMLLSRGADGVILVGYLENMAAMISDTLKNVPLVILDRLSRTSEIGQVYTDNAGSSYQMTKYLIEMGHRRIGCIIGPMEFDVIRERLKGYKKALKEYDIPIDPALIKEGDLTAQSAKEPAKELLADPTVTAIYCFNDLMAYGVYQLCSEIGKNIPDDVSVAGFDGIVYSEYLTPPLTTVRQPGYEIGVQAMKQLLQIIDDNKVTRGRIRLDNELLVRKSVKKID